MTIDYHISIGDRLTQQQIQIAQAIIQATFQEINEVFNKWNPDSELSHLNRLPAQTVWKLSPALHAFFLRVDDLVKLSGGRFDPTVEPLQQLWKEKLELGEVPSTQAIAALAPCVGWKKLHFDDGLFYKEDERTQLDLGGIAKGYCVDLLVERLHAAGFQHLFVEWGGEIRTLGRHPANRPWRVYISRLDNPDPSQSLAQIDLHNQALATSGDYFQYWTISDEEGKKKTYCHVFNPLTLAPLEVKVGSVASASLLAPDCLTADALAKVLMLFDSVEEAQSWLKDTQQIYPELGAWIVTR